MRYYHLNLCDIRISLNCTHAVETSSAHRARHTWLCGLLARSPRPQQTATSHTAAATIHYQRLCGSCGYFSILSLFKIAFQQSSTFSTLFIVCQPLSTLSTLSTLRHALPVNFNKVQLSLYTQNSGLLWLWLCSKNYQQCKHYPRCQHFYNFENSILILSIFLQMSRILHKHDS